MHTTSVFPRGYRPLLGFSDTLHTLHATKEFFALELCRALNLTPVPAPAFVEAGTGLNDDLNSVEKPVRFRVPALGGRAFEVPQSLAKWKRVRLAELEAEPGQGILADLTAIRPDESLDPLHSIYVDQWDWERVIWREDRTLEYLTEIVHRIYQVLRSTEGFVHARHPEIEPALPEDLAVIHSEELEDRFPALTHSQRETEAVREVGAMFLVGIGAPLRNGEPHDGRAPDYDDWVTPNGVGRGLNGDLIVWHPFLQRAYEISSMGIRVDAGSLLEQLRIRGKAGWSQRPFHSRLLANELPLTMGGGIGKSRTCAFLLR